MAHLHVVVRAGSGSACPAKERDQMPSKGRAMQGARSHHVAGKGGQKTFPVGRACPQCGEPLSQYNPGPNCWKHTVGYPWRGPTARPKT
jgi:hypothetical protein